VKFICQIVFTNQAYFTAGKQLTSFDVVNDVIGHI